MIKFVKIIVFVLFFASLSGVMAQSMDAANKLYSENDFAGAAKAYQALVDQGYSGKNLYYNLGNAYYKSNDVARAILNYERALKLNPSDEDAQANLLLANRRTLDKIEALQPVFLTRWWVNFTNAISVDSWAIIGIISFVIALFCFILIAHHTIINKTLMFTLSMFFLGLTIFFTVCANSQYSRITKSDNAIIMASTVNIKSAPSPASKVLFVLHEGTKVAVINENENWLNIKLSNGNEGWVEKTDLELF